MPDVKIEPKYSFANQYKLWATGSQLVKTALYGVPPLIEEEWIAFYSTWLIITEKDQHLIGHKDILKVASLTRKQSHYHAFLGIETVVEPLKHPTWKQNGYKAVLGRKRKDLELMGFLLYLADDSYVMGIWPVDKRTRYEQIDKSELQKLFRREIKDFTNPKLWKGVYLFTQPPK